jgi:NADPH:quinone reductase-like Zn-dependent oxidoreductase
MNPGSSIVLIIGATGSVGRYAVAEALRQGYAVRALVRDRARAARVLPDEADLVIGDLTRPETLGPAVKGVDSIVFTHGSTTSERDVRDIDYAGVANVLKVLSRTSGTHRPHDSYRHHPARRRLRPMETARRTARPSQRQPLHDPPAGLVRLQPTRPAEDRYAPRRQTPVRLTRRRRHRPRPNRPRTHRQSSHRCRQPQNSSSSSPTTDPNKVTSPPSSPHSRLTQVHCSTGSKTT